MFRMATGAGQIFFEGEGVSTGAPATTAAPATPAADQPWYQASGVAADHHDWLRAKGFADVNTALSSHRHLESLVGARRLAVPKDATDQPAYDAIYETLGRPPSAEAYKLPEGVEFGEGWKAMAPALHKAGLSQEQVAQITTAYAAEGRKAQEAEAVERANREAAEVAEVDKAWGSAKDANADLASRAFRSLGMAPEILDKIEGAIGYKATMELFHRLGTGMSEAALKTDGKPGEVHGGGVETAKRKINDLVGDPEFMKRYQNPNQAIRQAAIDEMQKWQKMANPEPARG